MLPNPTLHALDTWSAPDIVAALEEEILSGHWGQGSRLPSERILSEQFGVARSAIRESLRTLEERGLIRVQVGRGSFVRELSPIHGELSAELLARGGLVSARDLMMARESLEPAAAALAAELRTEDDLHRLRTTHTQLEGSRLPHSADADLEFHGAIMAASHNPVLQVMFGSIRTLTHAMMARSQSDPEVINAVPHSNILRTIEEQDPDAAKAAMIEHIQAASRYYGDDLDRPLADVLQSRAVVNPHLRAILERLRTGD